MDIERQIEINEARHFRADDRYFDKMDKAFDTVEREGLIGELIREGKKVHYINLRSRDGHLTGKTKEDTYAELVLYLMRNKYI